MDEIRDASGLSLKRIYQYFPSKDRLAEAYLARRDEHWMAALARRVERSRDPRQRVLAVFAFLGEWFATPDFRGCAFINAFGELGSGSAAPPRSPGSTSNDSTATWPAWPADAGAAEPQALAARLLILMDGPSCPPPPAPMSAQQPTPCSSQPLLASLSGRHLTPGGPTQVRFAESTAATPRWPRP